MTKKKYMHKQTTSHHTKSKHEALHPKPWVILDGNGTFVLNSSLNWKAAGNHCSQLLIFHHLAESGSSLENGFSRSQVITHKGITQLGELQAEHYPMLSAFTLQQISASKSTFPFHRQVTSEGKMWRYGSHQLPAETKS